ncbi:apolipoprotein L2-like [Octodon degus]|uniref:Apolipoprotein L2-like n=1 Tax=Octodon degus TaxID=10160 RepID=A0A6P3VBB0_OCTDE|nr:apolipoprotein L2-like [Octodon degus]
MGDAGNKGCTHHPDSDSFMEVVVGHILDMLSSEDLPQLLTEDVAWEILVEMTDLTREEADVVREALIVLTEFEGDTDKDLQARDSFLNAFPQVKKELEEGIAKLYALAEKVDKVHKNCTITKVVARSSSAVSGILTVLSLALAPVIPGGSLMLSATGNGLGAAAAVTGASASIVDLLCKLSAKAAAKRVLLGRANPAEEVVQGVKMATPQVVSATKMCMQAFQGIEKSICTMQVDIPNTRLLANTKPLMNAGELSLPSSEQGPKAFEGTTLVMSGSTRIMGIATAGVFLLMDVYKLVQYSEHLQMGSKTESTAELRQQAQVLERKLEELIQIHESLQQDLTK